MKKIAIDIRMLDSGGIGTYITHVVPALIKSQPENYFYLLGDLSNPKVRQWERDFTNVKLIQVSSPIYTIREQIELLIKIPFNVDLIFSPHFNISLFWASKTITTIHDCYHLENLQKYSFYKRLYLRFIFKVIKIYCRGILTVSNFSKSEICKFLNIHKEGVKVTPLGVAEYSEEVTLKKDNYFLFVGNLKPHKNINVIVEALDKIKDEIPHKLIIVGSAEQLLTPDTKLSHYKELLGDRISFTGFISDNELQKLYKNATALIFPSLYEGFGLPALEAKSFGCPTILSDISVFHEINGDSSLYFPPDNSERLSELMIEMSINSELRNQLIEKGLILVKNKKWENTNKEINDYFKDILNDKSLGYLCNNYKSKSYKEYKNILEITYRADIGGGPQHVLDVLQINKNDNNLRLYTCSPRGQFEKLYKKHSCGHLRIRGGKYLIVDLIRILIFCKNNNISILHSHGRGAGIYSRIIGLFGYKVIHTLHGVHTAKGLKGKIKLKLDKVLSLGTDLSILVSEDELLMARSYEVVVKDRSRVIYNGVNNLKFEDIYKKNLLHQNKDSIAMVARLDYQKGLDLLIQFIKGFQDQLRELNVRISVAGGGVYLNHYRKEVDHNGISDILFFVGEISDIRPFLEDKMCLLSFSRWEGFPLSVLEGLSSGLVSILSDAPGHRCLKKFPEVISFHNNGRDVVDAIIKVKEQDKIRDARKLVVENFSIERQIMELEAAYGSILNK